jgi:GT2 family glycosyltransferase
MQKRSIKTPDIAQFDPRRKRDARPAAIVAIPACNEAARIERCLAALAMQRDRVGSPVLPAAFEVLLLANNCTDATAGIARGLAPDLPYPLLVIEQALPPDSASAGGARRLAMEDAAARLDSSQDHGIILTTDADSIVSPTWFANTMRHIEEGADCVAGYIDADPPEIVSLGAQFLSRGRLEDTYLRQVAEILARCDPRPHDPWPNHRVASGASLAVKLEAYRAIGGLPAVALGEDVAFTEMLDRHGFKIRHALDVSVVTSCRLDGRAAGGAADTMRHRRDVPDAQCDADLEPALSTLRRAIMRGRLRRAWQENRVGAVLRCLSCSSDLAGKTYPTFHDAWNEICDRRQDLKQGKRLRPSDLPRQIAIARLILNHLRMPASRTGAPGDRSPHVASPDLAGCP